MTTPPSRRPEPGSRRAFLATCGIAAAGLGVGCRPRGGGRTDGGGSRFEDLVGFIAGAVEQKTVPGAGVMVSHRGETVLERSYGTHCGREQRAVPLDGSVVNLLYSVSKLISSTVIVMAKQAGRVEYDAPVRQYVPEFSGPGRDGVTVRHCLTLSTGIPSVPLGNVETEDRWRAALKVVCSLEPRWKPGSRSEFHNIVGHFLAAECVRRRSGMKPWNVLCKGALFEPLGAGSLSFEQPPAGTPLALSPQPAALPSDSPGFDDFSPGHPGAGCVGTVGDLMKVLNLHLRGGSWNGKALIEPAAFREMHTVQFAKQIADAQREGVVPAYQPWGLGVFLRGDGKAEPGYENYVYLGRDSPSMFGQNGITTVMTVADPTLDTAVVFVTTDTPKPESTRPGLWSGVAARAFNAVQTEPSGGGQRT